MIVLIICIAAIGYLTLCMYLFLYACRRKKKPDICNPHATHPSLGPYMDEVKEGIDWIVKADKEEWETVSYDGLKLKGYYVKNHNPKGTIMLVHGYASYYAIDFSGVFKYYYELGYSLLVINQRSHGESEGKYITFGIKERYDVLSWLKLLCEKIPEDEPVFLDGISMGASTVLMAAGLKLPQNVKGIIADCGFTSPWDQFEHILKRKKVPAFPVLHTASFFAEFFAGFSFREYSTLDAMKTNKIPVIFVHGEADNFVPCEFSRRNYEACVSEKHLITVADATHGMSYFKDQKRCRRALEAFLGRCKDENN